MISERDALDRLVAFHDHIAVPPTAVEDDARRGHRQVRRTRLGAGAAAVAVTTVVLATAWALGEREDDRLLPVGPSPSPSASAAAPLAPSRAALRPDSGRVVPMTPVPPADGDGVSWLSEDRAGDGARGAADILGVEVANFGGQYRLDWIIRLRESYPIAVEEGRAIEYGVVLDTDGDRVVDCQIGVSQDVVGTGQPFRSWVTNLRTGRTEEENGPPYGKLVDFVHPGEAHSFPGDTRELRLFFNYAETGPCEGYGARSTFYTWAGEGGRGRPTAIDYAPDATWLQMPGG